MLERLADRAARELGIDRAEIRRRNLIPPSPCRTRRRSGRPTIAAISRDLRARARVSDYGLRQRRAEAEKRGRLRGIGMACYVEVLGRRAVALCRHARRPRRLLRIGLDPRRARRRACARCSAPTITARATPPPSRRFSRRGSACRSSKIEIVEGDTARCRYGTGTFGSRSIAVGGSALDAPPARSSPRAS